MLLKKKLFRNQTDYRYTNVHILTGYGLWILVFTALSESMQNMSDWIILIHLRQLLHVRVTLGLSYPIKIAQQRNRWDFYMYYY